MRSRLPESPPTTAAAVHTPSAGPTPKPQLPPEGRAALRAGVVGNFIDNVHVFLPLTALTPALAVVAGPGIAATTGAIVVIAMMLGRPVGGMVFGRISDRLGRTRTTKVAITGTAACALLIAAMPTHELLGVGTIGLILALRFLGGIFVAGEYSAAIPLAMEWSAPRRRGLMSGLILSMAPWAQAAIAFATAVLLLILGPDAYAAWGWRALFVLGALASLGMLAYYRRRVVDAPTTRRVIEEREGQEPSTDDGPLLADESLADEGPAASGIAAMLRGRWARAFWQVFTLMTGLWLLTNTTVILLTAQLGQDTGLSATSVSIAMGIASCAQALAMALAGHLSTSTGRRRLFVLWGIAATVLGPVLWWMSVGSSTLAGAAVLAAALQVVTVAAYGPVSAYLSERFPTSVRSTGYGMGYSLSLILPALYPFYLPGLSALLGAHAAVLGLLVLGGVLLIVGAALGPRLSAAEIDRDLDVVADRGSRGSGR
ncbi:MFS transporter [Brachybacterium kimchii]|uniref:MFS transporter n=1 Tax=Brachybacterium kimchii TaxID=2942909 RepID=A0ABY4N9X2_9MICO|nr:MFS transporter [Brachybacterium kimchii]UQN30169.1 MFS transporter [Brachybacterium kimchii]